MTGRIWLIALAAACGHSSGTSMGSGDAPNGSDTGGGGSDTGGGGSDATSAGGYDMDGPGTYTVSTYSLTASGPAFNVTVYMPDAPGKHPAVSLSCGTQQTAAGYETYGKRLASWGIAMVMADDPGILTNTADVVPNAAYVVNTFLPTMFPDQIDTTKIGLAGHSRGGAVSLLVAEHELAGKTVAWFGLDPVDNEFGQNPREYARTDMSMLAIPTAFLGAGVTSNCAPAADSYELLYPLAQSPSALIIGVGAGHTQLESASGCTACTICSPSGTADSATVLAYADRYFMAFFARQLLGDTSVGAAFDGAGGPADVAAGKVTIEHK